MTELLEWSDNDFKAIILKMLQWSLWTHLKNFFIFLFLFFFLNNFIYLFVVNFVIHWNKTAMGLHVGRFRKEIEDL